MKTLGLLILIGLGTVAISGCFFVFTVGLVELGVGEKTAPGITLIVLLVLGYIYVQAIDKPL
jgi:hypothetical protein